MGVEHLSRVGRTRRLPGDWQACGLRGLDRALYTGLPIDSINDHLPLNSVILRPDLSNRSCV